MTLRTTRKKARRWQCRFCGHLSVTGQKLCSKCRMGRKTSAKHLAKTARILHTQIVRPAGTRCFNCNGITGVQDAHIIGKGQNRSPAVQWHPYNGIPLCKGPGSMECHTKFDSYQLDREALALRYLGAQRYQELKEAATKRWNKDWPNVIAWLRAVTDGAGVAADREERADEPR